MKGKWTFFGALGVASVLLAPQARADAAYVESVQGNRVIVNMGLMGVHVGDRVGLNVVPTRRYGQGQAIVTDLDVNSHRVALVLMTPLRDKRQLRAASSEVYPEEGITVPRNEQDFKLFARDMTTVRVLHHYTTSVPDFKLPPRDLEAGPDRQDILLPRGLPLPATGTQGPS